MTVKFIEPGTDATGGFENWSSVSGTTSDTTTKHSGARSIKVTNSGNAISATGLNVDAGGRASFWFNFSALPTAASGICIFRTTGFNIGLRLTTAGNLRLLTGMASSFTLGTQLGSDGATTLTTNTWYRINVTWNITNSTTFTIKIFLEVAGSVGTEITVTS